METDSHIFFITTIPKNDDTHQRAQIYLFIQKALGNHFNVLNSHLNKLNNTKIIAHDIAANIK